MILLLDNFDSFTYNLVDYLHQMNVNVKIFRNDTPLKEITNWSYNGIILSPGPGVPDRSGSLNAIIELYQSNLPILGICLGHQALGTVHGAQLVKSIRPMHGKISSINTEYDYIFRNLPSRLNVVRYHSLILKQLPSQLEPIAFTDDHQIMALRHVEYNLRGVQFHPEAILTESGFEILFNWIRYNNL